MNDFINYYFNVLNKPIETNGFYTGYSYEEFNRMRRKPNNQNSISTDIHNYGVEHIEEFGGNMDLVSLFNDLSLKYRAKDVIKVISDYHLFGSYSLTKEILNSGDFELIKVFILSNSLCYIHYNLLEDWFYKTKESINNLKILKLLCIKYYNVSSKENQNKINTIGKNLTNELFNNYISNI